MITLALSLTLSVGASDHRRPEAPACYAYDRDTLSLTGVVIRRVYPGRPNYESVEAGDAPDTVYVLRIPKAVCLEASSPNPRSNAFGSFS